MITKYRTKTLFIEGVIEDLITKLEVSLKSDLESYTYPEEQEELRQYFDQDRENTDGAICLLYDLGFITADERDNTIERTYNLVNEYRKKLKCDF